MFVRCCWIGGVEGREMKMCVLGQVPATSSPEPLEPAAVLEAVKPRPGSVGARLSGGAAAGP